MLLVDAANINDAFILGLAKLRVLGTSEDSRNGPVLVLPKPLTTAYRFPNERVLINPTRDGNPFFHLFESLWMLAGSQNLDFLVRYNKRMADYSDDGKTVRGSAYGWRWKEHFALDQIATIFRILDEDRYGRRAVLTMWDPKADLGTESKDLPCNTQVYFRVRKVPGLRDVLDMTVCCRSNDMIYGAYGSNVVHFSILQEFLANCLGDVGIGIYYQISNNAHVYTENPVWQRCSRLSTLPGNDLYRDGTIESYPLLGEDHPEEFLSDCCDMVAGSTGDFATEYFRRVVTPLLECHKFYRDNNYTRAVNALNRCAATDWKLAASIWLAKRGVKTDA